VEIPPGKMVESVEWHSPDGDSAALLSKMEDGFAVINVPPLNVYGLVRLCLQ
jgi:hypothetical protein